jgi:hypothetical protein
MVSVLSSKTTMIEMLKPPQRLMQEVTMIPMLLLAMISPMPVEVAVMPAYQKQF